MILDKAKTKVVSVDMSLELLLETIVKSVVGTEVMIVCHAYTNGFYMPLTTSSKTVFADTTAIDLIDQADQFARKADKVNALLEQTDAEKDAKVEAFKELIHSVKPGTISGKPSLKEIKDFFNQKFVKIFTNPLQIPNLERAKQFMDKARAVRNLKLDRIELRACNIGKNSIAMKAFKSFFGCKRLLAPNAETIFLNAPINGFNTILPNYRPQSAAKQDSGTTRTQGPMGRAVTDALTRHLKAIRHADAPTRTFWIELQSSSSSSSLPGATGSTIKSFVELIMTISIWELLDKKGERTFQYGNKIHAATDATGKAIDWSRVREFVEAMIMPSSSYHHGPLPLAGFWIPNSLSSGWVPWTLITPRSKLPPFTAGVGPIVFANEAKYLKLIESV